MIKKNSTKNKAANERYMLLKKNSKIKYSKKLFNLHLYFRIAGLILLFLSVSSRAATGTWTSVVTGGDIEYTTTESAAPIRDYNGKYLTVVYLENLGFSKVGRNSNAADVAWLLSQGYRVIELDYANNVNAVSPLINQDIIAINDAIAAGSFCGYSNCSLYRSYVLFEGYRILLDVPYFKDDPTIYNYPEQYIVGDTLHMDIIYPANASAPVPVVLSFSYSNSYAINDGTRDQRMNLGFTLAGFNDSFLEGLPANGIAWAIADHPKYCPWGSGKPEGGANDTYKSYETNPDAAQKVKSAIRTLRVIGSGLGLSDSIGIFGFSRGSDAGSMAVGDRADSILENTGFNIGISDDIQAAALGPGVFDFTQIYNVSGDGDINLETRCPWAWGALAENYDFWQSMGSAYLAQSSATAPVLFFYNTNDQGYYRDQIAHFKARLDSLGVPTSTLVNYGSGHSVPQTDTSLYKLYNFFYPYLAPPALINGNDDMVQICFVTIDLESGKNLVIWEHKSGYNIKTYRIYRKSNEENEYLLLGSIPYNDTSLFVDSTSLPEQFRYKYKISIVDSFNHESAMGRYHKPILLQFIGNNDGINLSWKKYEVESSSMDFASYIIYRGSDSTNLQAIDTVEADLNEYFDTDSIAAKPIAFYRIAGLKAEACASTGLNNVIVGSYVECFSNLVDNIHPSTGDIEIKVNTRNIPLSLSPNPVSDEMNILFSLAKAGKVEIEVYNLSGIMLYKTEKLCCQAGPQSETINIDELNLPQGIYFMKLSSDSMQGFREFVKN
ncbi:MAG: T9SS type A sorting domain-containing protein [Bacteroidales bacterium]|nr:T9SS type A sorting domain-containing protein [Bacteroidales bacterium]